MKLLHDSIAKLSRAARSALNIKRHFCAFWQKAPLTPAGWPMHSVSINEALQQCERTDERWRMSEPLGDHGEIALRDTATDGTVGPRNSSLKPLRLGPPPAGAVVELRAPQASRSCGAASVGCGTRAKSVGTCL